VSIPEEGSVSDLPVSFLTKLIFGDNMNLDGSADADELPNPFETLRHDGAVRAALVKSAAPVSVDLGWVLPPASDVDDVDGEFEKLPRIVRVDSRGTLAKKLGIVRSERVTGADGAVWIHAFNCRDELVDARVLWSGD
jgi:hypothetical protein